MPYGVLSVDVGFVNFGYTLFVSENSFINMSKESYKNLKVTFDTINLTQFMNPKASEVAELCKAIKLVFQKFANVVNIEYLIIEQQNIKNPGAMCAMYSIVSIAQTLGISSDRTIVLCPKLKFRYVGLDCPSEYHDRKNLSVQMFKNLLTVIDPEDVLRAKFDVHNKQDDIADSFNQAFTWLVHEKKLKFNLTVMKQK